METKNKYLEIIAKRKATIQNKRDAKLAKKEHVLKKLMKMLNTYKSLKKQLKNEKTRLVKNNLLKIYLVLVKHMVKKKIKFINHQTSLKK